MWKYDYSCKPILLCIMQLSWLFGFNCCWIVSQGTLIVITSCRPFECKVLQKELERNSERVSEKGRERGESEKTSGVPVATYNYLSLSFSLSLCNTPTYTHTYEHALTHKLIFKQRFRHRRKTYFSVSIVRSKILGPRPSKVGPQRAAVAAVAAVAGVAGVAAVAAHVIANECTHLHRWTFVMRS